MSLVSADNTELTKKVAGLVATYVQFQSSLRGIVAEVMSGLGSGVHTLMTMNQMIERAGIDYTAGLHGRIREDLGEVSESALETSKALESELTGQKALSVADALARGFASEIESTIKRAAARDVKTAVEFIRQQLLAGRFVATSDQLTHDLVFNFVGKMTIQTSSYVDRELNWAFRQHYNSIMVHSLLGQGIETAKIDGGSKAGETLNLMQYDQIQMKYFHHQSKSLLQPIDAGI